MYDHLQVLVLLEPDSQEAGASHKLRIGLSRPTLAQRA